MADRQISGLKNSTSFIKTTVHHFVNFRSNKIIVVNTVVVIINNLSKGFLDVKVSRNDVCHRI